MSTRLVVAKNTISQLVGRIISSGSLFIASILIARAFGVDGYGEYTKITSFVALFYLIGDFGMNAVYIQGEDSSNRWSTLFILRLAGGTLLVFVALGILAFLPHGTTQGYTGTVRLGIILFSPAIILQALITSANALFQKKLQYERSAAAVAVGSVATVVLIWLVTLLASPIFGPVASSLAFLGGTFMTALVSIFLVRNYIGVKLAFDSSVAKKLLIGSLPLGLTLLFNQIYFRADLFILTLTRTTGEVGVYGFLYKVFEVVLVIPTFFMNSVYPLMAERSDEIKHLTKKSLVALGISSIVFLVAMLVLSPFLVLVRPEFATGITALRVLSLSLPFFFLSSVAMWAIVSLKRQAVLVPIYGISMILNVVLNIMFIPTHGFIAASWITVVSEALVLFAVSYVLKKYL